MNQEQLLDHFRSMTLPYEKRIIDQDFRKQEFLVEELMNLVKKDFLSFTSSYPEAGKEWHILYRVFFSQLLGIAEDKFYDRLKPKLEEFSHATVDCILQLQEKD